MRLTCKYVEPPIGIELMTYALRGCHRALLASSKPGLASCSQVADGGDRWQLMAVRGHVGDTGPQCAGHVLGGAALSNDLPLQAGHIPSWRSSCECYRCGRSPLSAVGCCWCCQPQVVFPISKIIPRISREASGW